IIAAETGIVTIADFRRKDLAVGGQGAPLAPAFHDFFFRHPHCNRVIVNIGGIANITILPSDVNAAVLGFDTGPGNILLDAWCQRHQQQAYDRDGLWAAAGTPNNVLVEILLADPYFSSPAPKSTGREYFHLAWLQQALDKLGVPITPVDVQATLLR